MSKPIFDIELTQSSKNPFITVITRCYKRPGYLYLNKASINNQTYKNYNHYLLIDNIGQGIEAANSFFENADLTLGKYVFILDDDNALLYPNFFEDLYNIHNKENPDVIFFKKKQVIEYPTYKSWNKMPVIDHIDTSCFIVKQHLYKNHIHKFSAPKKGDFYFIDSIFNSIIDKNKIYWFDKVTNIAFRISGGKSENE